MKNVTIAISLLLSLVACDKSAPKPAAPAPAETKSAATAEPTNELTIEQATAGLPADGKLVAEIVTSLGAITCELFPDKAPKTVASFVGLARGLRPWKDPATSEWVKDQPFFDGLSFHRVIPGFMIQGGDPLSRMYTNPRIGAGDPGYSVPDEIAPDLKFDRPGRLAMANSGPHTNSGGSQFFITEVPRQHLDGGYAIFGQCDGDEVVKAIARVPVDHPQHNKPLEAVTMRVKISRR